MNREVCKFLSGSFAALAYAHGAYAVATSCGIVDAPILGGRRWGIGYMWTEAALYSAVSLALGYQGWKAQEPQNIRQEIATAGGDLRTQEATESTQSAVR